MHVIAFPAEFIGNISDTRKRSRQENFHIFRVIFVFVKFRMQLE